MSRASPKDGIRFGAFEVLPESGELLKHGIRIKLQDQPCKLLLALLEQPGVVVTREELRRRLWDDDTFVDFDHSLSAAVNRVREALSDTAENPRYIETVARRGYRFIAPVEGLPRRETQPSGPRSYSRLLWVTAGLLIVGGLSIWYGTVRETKPLPRLVPLTTLPGAERNPAVSPDGKQLAFDWTGEKQDNRDIYVKLVGSATESRLTSDPAEDEFPSWSPDGTTIAFASRRAASGIYLVSPLGGPERRIAALTVLGPPAWLPDGRSLVVWSRSGGEMNDDALFRVPAEGGGTTRLLLKPAPGIWHEHPAVAPDGSLAFVSCAGSTTDPMCHVEVVPLTVEGLPRGEPKPVTKPEGRLRGLTWAADGRALILAARSKPDRSDYLYRIRLGETTEPELLDLKGKATDPAVDRAGSRLFFVRETGQSDIWRWERGGRPSVLLRTNLTDGNPQFSADGQRIAFHSARSANEVAIWTANSDGTGWIQITKGMGLVAGSPCWSPDGRWIAFDSRNEDGLWDIWKVESSGGLPQRLTRGPSSNFIPRWSRDGKQVYFGSDRTARYEIWRMPADGGQALQVTRNGGQAAFESPDGKSLYFTKSDGGLEGLFSVPVEGGVERRVLKNAVPARAFAVVPDGIYYISPAKPDLADRGAFLVIGNRRSPEGWKHCEIRFYAFRTGRSVVVGEIGGPVSLGLTVSPDQKTFLYTRHEDEADLFMVDGFR